MIKPLVKGETPTLLETDKGNELINVINALQNMQVVRGSSDNFQIGYNNAVLTILARDEDGSIEEEDQDEDDSGNDNDHTHTVNTIQLWICENGTSVQKNFVIQ